MFCRNNKLLLIISDTVSCRTYRLLPIISDTVSCRTYRLHLKIFAVVLLHPVDIEATMCHKMWRISCKTIYSNRIFRISLCSVDRASFLNTLFLFQLDTLLFFPFYIHNFPIFSTCFGPAGPSSGESNYTCSVWHLSGCMCNLILLMMDQPVRNM